MLWSILISGIYERYHSAHGLLFSLLENQSVARMPDVELLHLFDNRRRSVGAKRNDLLSLARGEYLSFIDDDDEVANDYVEKIYRAICLTRKENPPADTICFRQNAILQPHGITHECTYSLRHWKERKPEERRQLVTIPGEDDKPRQDALAWSGPPAHTMVWRAEIAKSARFPDQRFGEDVAWVDQVCERAQKEIQIEGPPLYIYRFDESKSMTR